MSREASGCSQWSEQQKPPVDALNGAARATRFSALVWRWLAAAGV